MTRRSVAVIVLLVVVGAIALGLWSTKGFISGILPLARPSPTLPAGEPLPFSLPEGFTARLYAENVPGARVLLRDPRGALVVSLTSEGSVVALPDENGDGVADSRIEILDGLNNPHGLAFRCAEDPDDCTLYIAEEDAVRSYAYDMQTRQTTFTDTLIELPANGGHYTRTLLLHPDNTHLLVSIGSSCNVCQEKDSRRAAILKINMETGTSTAYATGLRNTVFMTIHPVTGEVWGTDMGRDLLGDDIPPDEVNILREGRWYGWPWFYGKNVEDLTFSPNSRPSFAQEPTQSHIDIPAHSAPLGLAFVPEEGWPEAYWHHLLIAYHGSWNRSVPTGYKIVRVPLDPQGNPTGKIVDFMTGFMRDGSIIGRPAGLLIEPGGVLYASDDRAGAIYRVTRDSQEE